MTQPQLTEPLTHAEQRVLELMAQGLSDREIANELFISPNTVRSDHKQHIYDKLGLQSPNRNKKQAIKRAQDLGLFGDTEQISAIEQLLKLPIRPEHNLPVDVTPFVGRRAEIAGVMRLIDDSKHRLITILAPGGMGKTRLALEVARHYIGKFHDGVFWVPLEALSDPDRIYSEIANSVEFNLKSGDIYQQILSFLSNKHMLLLFDNFDHLIDGASLLADIMRQSPDVTILVTSRERLYLTAETVYTLGGMVLSKGSPQEIVDSDAMRLLVQTAKRAKVDWQLTDENMLYSARICQLTQGLPLGILLAMSWLDMMSVKDIADEIAKNLNFLEADLRDLPERHHSIRAIFNGTWQRLSEREQSALAKMSVFHGGFTRRAARAVTDAGLHTLHSLAGKGLIQMVDPERYSLHGLLRQFAEEQLDMGTIGEQVRNAHMRYYASALCREEPRLLGSDRLVAIENIELDFGNVSVAWQRAYELELWQILDDMVRPLAWFRFTGIFWRNISDLFEMTLEKLQKIGVLDTMQERLFMRLASYYEPNDTYASIGENRQENATIDERARLLLKGLELAEKHQDVVELVWINWAISQMYFNQDDTQKCQKHIDQALMLARRTNDSHLIAITLLTIGMFRVYIDFDVADARQIMVEVEQIGNKTKRSDLIAVALHNRSVTAMWLEEWNEAKRAFEQALQLQAEMKEILGMLSSLEHLHEIAVYFMLDEQAQMYRNMMTECARQININETNARFQTAKAISYFVEGNYQQTLELLLPIYQFIKDTVQPNATQSMTLWIVLSKCLLGEPKSVIQGLIDVIKFHVDLLQHGMLILDCMAFLSMLQSQGDDIRSVELITMFNEHPKALPISNRHPYTLELQAQLQDRLDEDTYQQAWQRGAQLDPMKVAPALMEEFTAIYG